MSTANPLAGRGFAQTFVRQACFRVNERICNAWAAPERATASVYQSFISRAKSQPWRVHFTVCLGLLWATPLAFAADAPDYPIVKKSSLHHAQPKQKAAAKNDQIKVASLPASGQVATQTDRAGLKDVAATLSWDLAPLVAGADGGKTEGSGGASAQLPAGKPGVAFGPAVAVELQGFAIKTLKSTIRIDIHVGAMSHTITWGPAVTKSGAFNEVFTEAIPAGTMPDKVNASALAFVTKEGDGPAAILTLDKIIVKFARPAANGAQK